MKCVYHEEKQCNGNLECSIKCFTSPLREHMEDNDYDEELISTLEEIKNEMVREL